MSNIYNFLLIGKTNYKKYLSNMLFINNICRSSIKTYTSHSINNICRSRIKIYTSHSINNICIASIKTYTSHSINNIC